MLFRSSMLGTDIHVPAPGEYVADGAAKQAAWALLGSPAAPEWELGASKIVTPIDANDSSEVVASYLDLIASI